MPKILLATNDFPPIVSGISTVFYNLFKYMGGKDITILAPKAKGSKTCDSAYPVKVIRHLMPVGEGFASKVFKTVAGSFLLIYYSKKLHIDKIHCGQIISNGVGGLLCKRLFLIPYVVWVCGSETVRLGKNRFMLYLLKRVLDGAERIIVNSEFTREEYLSFGVEEDKIAKINPGVDTSLFRPMERSAQLLKKFGLSGKKVMLTVSRLDERKGHDMVIEALGDIVKSAPDAAYLIVGKGREEERLKGLVKRLGFEKLVVFAGYVPDEELPLYYNLSDLFILPNRITRESRLKGDYEGFGIVFLEASACGKPVIGGRTGGAGDAVEEGKSGFLIDPDSKDEIIRVVTELLGDEEMSKKLGSYGRKRAVESFDWKVLAKELETVL